MRGIVRQPSNQTYWRTASLIDHLVSEYGVATLGNVGNRIDWNVCKTGLINELRDKPADCFVLHDLTKLTQERVRQALPRFDAVVVLDRFVDPDGRSHYSPGLNRSYGAVVESLTQDPQFVLVPTPQSEGLPHLSVYVKGSKLGRTEQSPRTLRGQSPFVGESPPDGIEFRVSQCAVEWTRLSRSGRLPSTLDRRAKGRPKLTTVNISVALDCS